MEKINFDEINDVMVLAAHADDAEWYAGGTIKQLTSKGKRVTLVVATDGRIGTHKREELSTLVDTRMDEQLKAANVLGVNKVYFLGYPDLMLAQYSEHLRISLTHLALRIRPDTVLNFDPDMQNVYHDDFHPDHKTISEVGLYVFKLYATLVAYTNGRQPLLTPNQLLYDTRNANVQVDITSEVPFKITALDQFVSQELEHNKFLIADGRTHFEQFNRHQL